VWVVWGLRVSPGGGGVDSVGGVGAAGEPQKQMEGVDKFDGGHGGLGRGAPAGGGGTCVS
jgi:hypothetical protein